MEKNEELKNRILRGIEYFRDIEPSKWTSANAHHVKVLLRLMESYLKGEEVHFTDLKEKSPVTQVVENVVDQVKEVFGQ